MMLQFWEERYGKESYAYGKEPNNFFKEQIENLAPRKILFPAEGEGRNSVYAALKGHEVHAFDLSSEGKKKAELLANEFEVKINYIVSSFGNLPYLPEQFDTIVLIYAHFPADLKSTFHQELCKYLKPGGTIIFEAFSKNHIKFNSVNEKAGGPKDLAMLFSIEELQKDFLDFDIQLLVEEETELSEGIYHIGRSSVVRFVGKKK
jgi:SAM-dependent methyltransferase